MHDQELAKIWPSDGAETYFSASFEKRDINELTPDARAARMLRNYRRVLNGSEILDANHPVQSWWMYRIEEVHERIEPAKRALRTWYQKHEPKLKRAKAFLVRHYNLLLKDLQESGVIAKKGRNCDVLSMKDVDTEGLIKDMWRGEQPPRKDEPYINRRLALKKYMNWTDDEIAPSERVVVGKTYEREVASIKVRSVLERMMAESPNPLKFKDRIAI